MSLNNPEVRIGCALEAVVLVSLKKMPNESLWGEK
jgi:hypothetical protein